MDPSSPQADSEVANRVSNKLELNDTQAGDNVTSGICASK